MSTLFDTAVSVAEVKRAASGQWVSLLMRLGGLSAEQLIPNKNQPCPKCGGKDRYAAFSDVATTGGVNCRKCHSERNGDGLATLQWATGRPFGEIVRAVAEEVGLVKVASHPAKSASKAKVNGERRIVATYDYRNANGSLAYQVVRYEPKDFRQRKPDGKGGWTWSVKGEETILYRLPDVLAADATQWLAVVEGEKDADNLWSIGIPATCNPMGAGKWRPHFTECLKGRRVVVIPDRDEPGRKHGENVAASLMEAGITCRVVEVTTGKDASEYLAAGGDRESLLRLIAEHLDCEAGGESGPEETLSDGGPRVTPLDDAMADYIESVKRGQRDLVKTGLNELDAAVGGGFDYGEMVILAARPSHGKTAVALQFVHHWTNIGLPCVFVSEEMSARALGKRALQFVSTAHHEEWGRNAEQLLAELSQYREGRAKAWVIEGCGTVQRVSEAVVPLVQEHGIKCIVIDYAQLLRGSGRGRYEQVTEVSMALREITNATGCIVCVLCQLNRGIESRDIWVPKNSDLKDSGQLEQDADVILHLQWLHRCRNKPSHDEWQKLSDEQRREFDPNLYRIFVGKNRNREIVHPAIEFHFEPSRQMLMTQPDRMRRPQREEAERITDFDAWNEET